MSITLPSTPSAAMLNLSALVYLLGLTIITWCIAHTTQRYPIWRKESWCNIPWPRLCLLLLFMDSWFYLFSTGILLHGAPPQHGVDRCSVGMLACILLYGASKGLIYLCMIERVHVVWSDGMPRWRSPIYRFCFALLLPLGVIAGVMAFQKTAFVHNGYCILGISRFSSLLLLSYDFCINIFLTMMFVGPLMRSSIRSPWLRAIAIRTSVAAFIALLSSGTNVLILYVLDGKEMIWVCLGACGIDLTVNCIALFWAMTGPGSSLPAPNESLRFPPSPMGHNPWLNNCNLCGGSEMKSFNNNRKSAVYPTTFTHDFSHFHEEVLSQGMTVVSSVCIPAIEEPEPALRSPRQITQFGQHPWGSRSSFPATEQPGDSQQPPASPKRELVQDSAKDTEIYGSEFERIKYAEKERRSSVTPPPPAQ
ncbi:unnamed protein product [Rhizoctonia solani]|uniref:Transmembrane protein n=1 Tax=Rhizoctonia solani TaxID=456999 RepID=A0A8H3GFU0_9AGAM|nr:unnamed protein product [Rhizoctonia solani]